MATFFIWLLTKIWAAFLAFILLFVPGARLRGEAIKPLDRANLKLNFTILADVHMESYTFWRFQDLRLALRDIKRAEVKSDALVLLGDNTMNGQFTEYTQLYSILSLWNSSKNTLVAMGNHDINHRPIGKAVKRHNHFFNALTGAKNDKPYYSRVINGYTFIVLGSEDEKGGLAEDWTYADFSPAQITWLDAELAKAAESEKPIFVFNHQPLLEEHWPYGTVVQGEEVFEVLKKYKGVFYFSGHTHYPGGDFEEADGVYFVNVGHNFSRQGAGGPGYYVEVSDTHILLRLREFANGKWAHEEHHIGLKGRVYN